MEGSGVWCGVGVLVILAWLVLKILNWVWFKPKKIEKLLRKQGFKGLRYKLYYGDLKEKAKMLKEAKSKPINLTDDVIPRIMPLEHRSITTYGKTCFTWMGPKSVLHITEPNMVREILANNNHEFYKIRVGNPFRKLLIAGLANAETDRWSKHRKIINPAFHAEKLKHMVPAFYISCMEMINRWEKMLEKERSCEVDVWPHLLTLSSDAISRTAFGSNFEEGKRIFELQRELEELVIEAAQSIYLPGFRFLPTKRNKRIHKIDREVKADIRSIIDKRMIAMKHGKSSNDDLLGILLDSNYEEIKQSGNINSGLSMDEVIDECKLFYIAGHETIGTLLVWTMFMLAQHTSWQQLARDEISLAFGDKKPDMDGLNRLKTVNMIFNEVLRLYPPVVLIGRMIQKDTKLGDITLPAGSFFQLHTMHLHHDPNIRGEDVKEFKPERFSEGVSKVTKGQVSFLPFGWGPRTCIGMNFALLEAKLALSMILQHYCFELSPSYSHAPHTLVSLQPQFGVHLILHKL